MVAAAVANAPPVVIFGTGVGVPARAFQETVPTVASLVGAVPAFANEAVDVPAVVWQSKRMAVLLGLIVVKCRISVGLG